MTGNDNGEHVRAIRAADGATRVRNAETLRHPRIRTRLRHGYRAQNLPGPHLEIRSDRRERDVELEIFTGEITRELGTDRVEVTMLARHDVRLQTLAQSGQFAFERAPIGEFEKAQPLIVRDGQHRAERRLDSFGEHAGA